MYTIINHTFINIIIHYDTIYIQKYQYRYNYNLKRFLIINKLLQYFFSPFRFSVSAKGIVVINFIMFNYQVYTYTIYSYIPLYYTK